MTGCEVAHAPRLGLRPVIVVINNGEWGIFGPVVKHRRLLALPNWPYAEMATGWGGVGMRVRSAGELATALTAAADAKTFTLIEAVTPPDDLSPLSRAYIGDSVGRGSRGAGGGGAVAAPPAS